MHNHKHLGEGPILFSSSTPGICNGTIAKCSVDGRTSIAELSDGLLGLSSHGTCWRLELDHLSGLRWQLLQHVGFPSFTGTECLPVTNPQLAVDAASKKDGPGPHAAAAAKRGARAPSTCTPARAFVACSLATCVATMVLLYSRLSQA